MPMYEYRCHACAADFEELVRTDDEQVDCPECGSPEVTRKLSVFGYRSSGSSRPATSSGGSSCGSCSSGNCGSCGHH